MSSSPILLNAPTAPLSLDLSSDPFRIVNLDAQATNPGDLSWEPVAKLGELQLFPRAGEDALAAAEEAHAVLTNKTPIGRSELKRWPCLRYIGVVATGTNLIDLEACQARGVVVTNVPDYSTTGVAQHVFALLLELTNQVARHDQATCQGAWSKCGDFSLVLSPIHELSGQTLGIIGMGAIGKAVAKIGHAFGMKIWAALRKRQPSLAGVPVTWHPLNELVAAADVVSLHCPLTPETHGLINRERLATMKRSAILINTSRGGLVDEAALADALHAGRLAGAGLDVLNEEPPLAGSPVIGAPNARITPHNAWASVESRKRVIAGVAKNLEAFLAGTPINVVRL